MPDLTEAGATFGLYIVRPPGDHPARKVRVLTDFLLEQFVPMCAGQKH